MTGSKSQSRSAEEGERPSGDEIRALVDDEVAGAVDHVDFEVVGVRARTLDELARYIDVVGAEEEERWHRQPAPGKRATEAVAEDPQVVAVEPRGGLGADGLRELGEVELQLGLVERIAAVAVAEDPPRDHPPSEAGAGGRKRVGHRVPASPSLGEQAEGGRDPRRWGVADEHAL